MNDIREQLTQLKAQVDYLVERQQDQQDMYHLLLEIGTSVGLLEIEQRVDRQLAEEKDKPS